MSRRARFLEALGITAEWVPRARDDAPRAEAVSEAVAFVEPVVEPAVEHIAEVIAEPVTVAAAQIVATGPQAQARLDRELPLWGGRPGTGVGVAGDAAAVAASAERYRSYGITSYGIQPTADEPDLEGFIGFIGGQVMPLVTRPTP